MFKTEEGKHKIYSDYDFIEEQLENGQIKRYIKGRTLGKVLHFIFREVLPSALSVPHNKLEKGMQPKSLPRKV